jgi:transposase-like protein
MDKVQKPTNPFRTLVRIINSNAMLQTIASFKQILLAYFYFWQKNLRVHVLSLNGTTARDHPCPIFTQRTVQLDEIH